MWRFALPLALMAAPVWAQEKEFTFTGIDSIDARNGVTVNVVPGDEISIVAEARAGDVEKVEIRKFGPWLAINRHTRWFIFPYGRTDDIVVTVTLPELRNIKAFDTAVATADGFSSDSLRAEALQGGTVAVTDVDVAEFTLNATEDGVVTVTGACGTAIVEAQYDAQINAADLACDNVAATARSGARVTAQAAVLASQDALGGEVTLQGTPQIVDVLPGLEDDADASADAKPSEG